MQDTFFKGLKVVEFASVLAGPAVGMFFAELGAEVIKIENKTTGGDVTRAWKQPSESPESLISAYWCSVNWGKKHLLLDLTQEKDHTLATQLSSQADVVISNFKPSSARKMQLDPDTLLRLNPGLIYAQLNAFSDPEDESPAFDAVLQAEAGFMYMNGEAERPPVKMPVALIDILAAHQLKEAILLGLIHKARTGKGCTVTASLMESALASLANQACNYLMNGSIPQRMGTRHPNIAPYGDTYLCADGQILLLAVGTERQFSQLCRVLGLEHLLEHPDYQTNKFRVVHRNTLNQLLEAKISHFQLDEIMEQLQAAKVPAARIRNMASVFQLPAAQSMILEETLENGQHTRRMKTIAFKMS
jgi:crotonobetainyl-CoA:carnitine CoA-transferase CaiB-like acyl-CoA transferase